MKKITNTKDFTFWRVILFASSFIGLFILSACATSSNIKPNHKFGQEGTGLIYGTVFTKDGFDADLSLYRKGEGKHFRTFSAVDSFKNRDFNENGAKGSLFAVAVPAGEYEIRKFRNSHKITKTVFRDALPKTKQTLSFKVGSNSPVYIGSYYASGFTKGKLEIYNKMNKAKKYLLKKYPKLGTTKSVNQTPKLKTWE